MMMPASGEENLRTTGGQVDNVVLVLLDSTHDKNEEVTAAFQTALYNLGKHQPNLVLSSCHSYITRHPKISLVHRVLILDVIKKVCNNVVHPLKIDKPVAVDLVKLSLQEMVNTKEIIPEWQGIASGILVALGRTFPDQVMEPLLQKFIPGVMPHFFVVQTIAELASANVFDIVPYLKSVLGTMLPLLGMVKSESMKLVFANALTRFCESIIEYINSRENETAHPITKDQFRNEICSAYEILFNNWISSRDPKVRAEVLIALGNTAQMLSAEKLEEHIPKLVPAILSVYRKNQELHLTTQGLWMVLDAAIKNHSLVIESQIDSILNTLFPQICIVPDYSQPAGVKNHNEVLRCFTELATVYSNRLVPFLLQRLESSNETHKIGSLTALKHLINSCEVYIAGKMSLIVTGLKGALDSGNKVKKVIAQVIVTLAHHEHLKSDDGLELLTFIIYQCALPDDPPGKRPIDMTYVSNEALRAMCENVLLILTTTIETMEEFLWPRLLEYLLDENLTYGTSAICKSLMTLASKKRNELGLDFTIDYGSLKSVTSAQCLLARLLVLIARPHEDRGRGINVLKFMKAVAPAIHKGPVSVWDLKIPLLIQMLDGNDISEWNPKKWELEIRDLLEGTFSHISREDWTVMFGRALLSQFSLYKNSPDDKYNLMMILSSVMSKITNKSFLNECLDTIFENVNHSYAVERKGCACAVGKCGSAYPDLVLVKLEKVAKMDKKNAGLLGFIKEFTGDPDHDKVKATITLCYGYLTINTQIAQISSRIETPILRCIANFYKSSKDISVKQSMLQSIRLIADAVHLGQKENLCSDELRSRNELLGLMKETLKSEAACPLTTNIRALALKAAASLVYLNPALKEEEKKSLIEVAIRSTYSLPRDFIAEKPKEEGIDHTLDFDQLLLLTVKALNHFLNKILLKDRSFENLEFMIQLLQKSMVSQNSVERERSLHSCLHLLHSYVKASEGDAYTPFNSLGNILGILTPKCTDPQVSLRHVAFDCIDVAIALSMKVQVSAVSFNEHPSFSLAQLKAQIAQDDPAALFASTKDLGKFLAEKVPLEQLYPFLRSLVNGLLDPHFQCVCGTTVIITTVIKKRGREIRIEIPNFIEAVRSTLTQMNFQSNPALGTRVGALKIFHNLASHNLPALLASLLSTPVPLDITTIDIWITLCEDRSVATLIIEHFLDIFADSMISSPPDPHGRLVAAHTPLSAVCALREIFKAPEMAFLAIEHFDQIFSSLVIVIGTYIGAAFPTYTNERTTGSPSTKKSDSKAQRSSPVRFAIETMKNFLCCAKVTVFVVSMNETGYWTSMEEAEKFPMSVKALGRFLCSFCPDQVPKVITFLNPLLNSSVDIHRVVAVSLFVEFLSQCYKGHKSLTEPLMNSLLGRLVDAAPVVRRMCIIGLGNIAMLDKEQIERYSTTILSAMMAGMDDRDDPNCSITLAAMSGLSSILSQVAEEDIRNILINIAMRIKPMFEKDQPMVRSAAITLFGNLSRFANGPSQEQFVQQVHGNLITILLHLNEEDRHVINACKQSLKELGPVLSSEPMNSMFQKFLFEETHLNYGEFINDITKHMISDFPDKIGNYSGTCLTYLKSPSPTIQCNAAAFLGFLLGNLPVNSHNLIQKERVCSALLALLKDSSPEVRIRAAESLSFLHNY